MDETELNPAMSDELIQRARKVIAHDQELGGYYSIDAYLKLVPALCDALEAARAENAQLRAERDAASGEVQRLRKAMRWIPVEERLPDTINALWLDHISGIMAVGDIQYMRDGKPVVAILRAKDGVYVNGCFTHWMPLPAAPEPRP